MAAERRAARKATRLILAEERAWADRINGAWRHAAESVIECGQMLITAKDELPHGSFQIMVENELAFSRQTAFRLMAIAEDQRLSNVAHAQHLPASWYTLYELTKLDDDTFQRGIAEHVIKPDMKRSDVAKLLRGDAPTDKPLEFDAWRESVLRILSKAPNEWRERILAELAGKSFYSEDDKGGQVGPPFEIDPETGEVIEESGGQLAASACPPAGSGSDEIPAPFTDDDLEIPQCLRRTA